MSQKQYGVKNFIPIANDYVNPDVSTMAGIEKFLIGWFCFRFNTTPKDDRLQEMTLEELMVLYQMHRIKDDPSYAQEQLSPSAESYEDFLRKEMGEDYVSEEENIRQLQEEEEAFTKRIRDQFPERVETDFSQFAKKE